MLRARRERLGLTRAALANRTGCSMTFLANVEAGYEPRTSATLDRAEEVLRDLEAAVAGSAP